MYPADVFSSKGEGGMLSSKGLAKSSPEDGLQGGRNQDAGRRESEKQGTIGNQVIGNSVSSPIERGLS